ncbi:MAG: hypothetical protein JNL72_07405 [Flavipsychrobacter sp.]|nr:hypothetical protein [Flavipsychrobacter sp.]
MDGIDSFAVKEYGEDNKKCVWKQGAQQWELELVDESRSLAVLRLYMPGVKGIQKWNWTVMREDKAAKLRVVSCMDYWKEKEGKGYKPGRHKELQFLPEEYQ